MLYPIGADVLVVEKEIDMLPSACLESVFTFLPSLSFVIGDGITPQKLSLWLRR